MHYLIGFITAVMVLFPGSDTFGKSLYQLWMESYEKYLYQQMAENFEREKAETVTFEPKNAVSVQNLEVNDEQTAEEETTGVLTGSREDAERIQENLPTGAPVIPEEVEQSDTSYEEVAQVVDTSCTPEVVREVTPLYSVNGAVLAEEIQVFLFQRLSEQNIAYFMPYAMMIIYQESKLDIYAENPNGRDKGLLQYRVEYVPWMDWRNPYQQIDYFVAQMANRAAAGCTVSEMISRHNTSDYGSYNQSYVDAVMQHSNTLARIR